MKWFLDRFKYAWSGLCYAVQDKSILIHFCFACIVIICGSLFHVTSYEWMWLILFISLVICGEIFNTCIERIVDYISVEKNEQAKQIKDMAAGAEFILCIGAAVVGLMIFLPKIF